MTNKSLTQVDDNKKTITITDEITDTSFEVIVFRDKLPDMYGVLIREVYKQFGLRGDTFRLQNVRDDTLYPRCLDHMFELRQTPLAEMGIKGDDKLLIVRTWQASSPSGFCQDSPVNVADKINQTEPDNSTDLFGVHTVPIAREREWYGRKGLAMSFGRTFPRERANEFDIYVRQYFRIIDLSDEFRRVSLNDHRTPIMWNYKGKTFRGGDTNTLTTVGISDGSVIEYYLGQIPEDAGKSENLFSNKTIGVQTVAKPAVQYPRVQPPPPVHNPPPAKT